MSLLCICYLSKYFKKLSKLVYLAMLKLEVNLSYYYVGVLRQPTLHL